MKRSIIHVLDINAPHEAVCNAITTIDGLANWWTTDVSGSAVKEGIIQFRFADVFKPQMKVSENTDSTIVWECIADEEAWAGDKFRFVLGDAGGRVTLTFNQQYVNDITDEQYGRFNFNWGYYLNSLKQYCETGKGMPFSVI
jgi:hypothetical protein